MRRPPPGNPAASPAALARAALALALLLAADAGAADVACPSGTELRGGSPPEQTKLWCETPEGVRHGPWRQWYRTGELQLTGAYVRDAKDGWWTLYNRDGRRVRAEEHDADYGGRAVARLLLHDAWERKPERGSPLGRCPDGGIVGGSEGQNAWCERRRPDGAWEKHGLQVTWHPEGGVRSRRPHRAGLPHGTWEYLDTGGKVHKRERWHAGVKQSTVQWSLRGERTETTWHPDGRLRRSVHYDPRGVRSAEQLRDPDGTLQHHILYDGEGRKTSESVLVAGAEDRVRVISYYPDGRKKGTSEWRREENVTRAVGPRYAWTPDGRLLPVQVLPEEGGPGPRSVEMVYQPDVPGWAPEHRARPADWWAHRIAECPRGQWGVERVGDHSLALGCEDESGRQGLEVTFEADGDRVWEASYRDDRLDGAHVRWYDDGRLEVTTYRVGERHGPAARWWPNGARNALGRYRDGVEDGRWWVWRESGLPVEQRDYRAGEKHGTWIRWSDAGTKRTETEWRHGVRHGEWRSWNRFSGNLQETGAYRDGEKHGVWRRYGPRGRVESEERWEAGRPQGQPAAQVAP